MRKVLCIALCLIATAFALAQPFDPVARIEEARQRAAAVRAARVDALRQLGESIKGVRINSQTTVKDFVTESDKISAQFQSFLQGAQQEGNPNIYDDGTVEVKMVMYLNEVVVGLQDINKQNPSRSVSPNDFNKMQNYAGRKFEAVGTGAMKVNPSPASNVDLWRYVTPPGRLMARRAAQIDAYRAIGETIQGLQLDSDTQVEDFVCQSDQIKAAFMGLVQGVSFEPNAVYRPDGLVEVVAFIDVQTLINTLGKISQQHYRGNDPTYQPRTFGDVRHYFPNDVVRATGVGAPPSRYIMRTPSYSSIANDNPFNRIPDDYTPSNPTTPVVAPPPVIAPPVIIPPTPKAPAPPGIPGLSLNAPVRPQLPPLPRPPERFVPEWAKREITATGTGAYREDLNIGQARAMARRAAQLDAYRMLAENALGVQLDSETTVKDFIAESDKITVRVNECFLRGAQEVNSRDFPDGRYFEVDMKLFLGDMWEIIDADYNKTLVTKYGKKLEEYQPDQLRYAAELETYKAEMQNRTAQYRQYVQQLQQYNTQYAGQIAPEHEQACRQYMQQAQSAVESGSKYNQQADGYLSEFQQYKAQYQNYYKQYQSQYGTYEREAQAALLPGPPVPPRLPVAPPVQSSVPNLPSPPERFVPEWAQKYVTATGTGAYRDDLPLGQAIAMAKRAAQVDAYRLLCENAMGVNLESETTVQDFIATSDRIKTRIEDYFLRGAQEVAYRDVRDRRYAEVDMKLFLGDMWEIIDAHYNKVLMEKYGKKLEDYQPDQTRYNSELDLYKAQLEEYKLQYQNYLKQLNEYQRRYGQEIAQNPKVGKQFQKYLQQFQGEAQGSMQEFNQYANQATQYRSESAQYEANYRTFNQQYQVQYQAYAREATEEDKQ